MRARAVHKKLYKQIPEFECIKGCTDCCTPVQVSKWEARRLHLKQLMLPTKPETTTCIFASPDGCMVYDKRPFICRLFGTSEASYLTCKHGCRPKKLLSLKKESELCQEYAAIIGILK